MEQNENYFSNLHIKFHQNSIFGQNLTNLTTVGRENGMAAGALSKLKHSIASAAAHHWGKYPFFLLEPIEKHTDPIFCQLFTLEN